MIKTRAGLGGAGSWGVALALWTLPAGTNPSMVQARQQPFALQPNDHICIIGNTLAERLQYDGWLETMLQARFPKHELVVRNLGFSGDEINTRLRSKNFGTPGRVAERPGAADRRLRGQPVRRHEHEGGRRLRLLRLQRVLRRRGRTRRLQEGPGATGLRTRWRRSTTAAVGAARRALLADRARGSAESRPARTARRTISAWRSTPRPWREVAQRRQRDVRRSLHANAEALRRQQAAADDPGRPPERRGQPAGRAGRSTARSSATRRSTRTRCWRSSGRRSSTRTRTGSSAIA